GIAGDAGADVEAAGAGVAAAFSASVSAPVSRPVIDEILLNRPPLSRPPDFSAAGLSAGLSAGLLPPGRLKGTALNRREAIDDLPAAAGCAEWLAAGWLTSFSTGTSSPSSPKKAVTVRPPFVIGIGRGSGRGRVSAPIGSAAGALPS